MAPLLALIAAGTIYAAANLRSYGIYWAHSVCNNTGDLCNHSDWVATVIVGAVAAYVIKRQIAT